AHPTDGLNRRAGGHLAIVLSTLGAAVAPEIRLIRADEVAAGIASGGMTRADAISAETVGSSAIFTVISRIAPGHRSSPYVHTNCESSIYVVSGRGRMLTGERLEAALPMEAGSFLFVPPGAPHAPVN